MLHGGDIVRDVSINVFLVGSGGGIVRARGIVGSKYVLGMEESINLLMGN